MAFDKNKTFTVKYGITIKNKSSEQTNIYYGIGDPITIDDGTIEISSLYIKSSGDLFQKTSNNPIVWQSLHDSSLGKSIVCLYDERPDGHFGTYLKRDKWNTYNFNKMNGFGTFATITGDIITLSKGTYKIKCTNRSKSGTVRLINSLYASDINCTSASITGDDGEMTGEVTIQASTDFVVQNKVTEDVIQYPKYNGVPEIYSVLIIERL